MGGIAIDATVVHSLLLPRLYFSSTVTDSPGRPLHATWEFDARSGNQTHALKTAPDGTGVAPNPSNMGVIVDHCNYQGRYVLPNAVLLAGQVRGQTRVKARSGLGIGAQGHQSQLVVRVYTAVHALKGTPLAPHEPGVIDSVRWANEGDGNPNPPMRNAKFPAGSRWTDALGAPMTPVACDPGDYLLVELGGRAIELGQGMGANTQWTSQYAADLPANDESSIDEANGWLEFWS